jgi:hypothetical protein
MQSGMRQKQRSNGQAGKARSFGILQVSRCNQEVIIMMERTWKKEAVTDVLNVVLGAFLFVSPWIFGFVPETAATWNACLSGIVIAGLAIAALAAFAEWEEWLNLIVGLWVAASPWLVNFSANRTAMGLHLIVGIIVAVIAGVRLWLTHDRALHA